MLAVVSHKPTSVSVEGRNQLRPLTLASDRLWIIPGIRQPQDFLRLSAQ
jgi:hypothetical protein